jgi:glycosyltransferase involved in cell wall biosynthesis
VIVVIIPVFNEEKKIKDVINSVKRYCDELIIVNDGSNDQTKEILESLDGITLVNHKSNQGIGSATKTGVKKAIEIGAEYILKFDGDGQHMSTDIPEFIKHLKEKNYDFVKGNRFQLSIEEMPLIKIIGNFVSTTLQKVVTGNFRISDPNNGFIAFRASIFDKVQYKYLRDDYFFENSLLMNLIVFKYKIAEVPIKTIYGDEKSSIPLLKGSVMLLPIFMKFLYLKNYLNAKYNLSIGSMIFAISNILIILRVVNPDFIELGTIYIVCCLYVLIEVINFLND